MGNYTSSCFTIPPSKPKTAKLLDFHGNLRQVIKVPVKAAELMLEEPGFVVSSLLELRRTRHLIALRAEDELFAGEIYLFVPLNRVKRKISESEMEVIQSAAAASVKISRKRQRGAKILPAVPVEEDGGEVESEAEVLELQDDGGFAGCRLGNYRHWTPVLEPISEEP